MGYVGGGVAVGQVGRWTLRGCGGEEIWDP